MPTVRTSAVRKTRRAAPSARRKRPLVITAAHDEKRIEIIECCARLFDRVGYHGASMQMLADEMGMGKPTLYHYFASKTDILYEMHQVHIDALFRGLEPERDVDELDPAKVLEQACTLSLRQIAEHPGYVRAFMDHYTELEGRQRSEIRKRRERYLLRVNQIIDAGIAKRQFRAIESEVATLAFLGMSNWAYKWYPRMAGDHPPEKMAQVLCQIFLTGLNNT